MVSEKAPEIRAWEAMTVAAVASATSGSWNQSGAMLKNGLSISVGSLMSMAPWPK